MAEENLFADIAIEEAEELPKRMVAGREALPNPFVQAVKDSYDIAQTPDGEKKAVRGIVVPVERKKVTVRTQVRKDAKTGEVADVTQWEQHPNITTALYLLRQAAIKNNIGVRIVVDYDAKKVNGVAVPQKDKDGNIIKDAKGNPVTDSYDDVTRHTFIIKDDKVRVRFLGQKKKKQKKGDDANDTTSNAGVTSAA